MRNRKPEGPFEEQLQILEVTLLSKNHAGRMKFEFFNPLHQLPVRLDNTCLLVTSFRVESCTSMCSNMFVFDEYLIFLIFYEKIVQIYRPVYVYYFMKTQIVKCSVANMADFQNV